MKLYFGKILRLSVVIKNFPKILAKKLSYMKSYF